MGIKLVLGKGILGEIYNIGGWNERKNLYIVYIICEFLDELKLKEDFYKN